MNPSKTITTLELDPADRMELFSLLEKLDYFQSLSLSFYHERINRALTHKILCKGVDIDKDLNAIHFFNELMLCVARHGKLAEKISKQINQDMSDEDHQDSLQASARD